MSAATEVACWNCGGRMKVWYIRGNLQFYKCDPCDVTWRPNPSLNAFLTDPERMAAYGYIDHATVHAPCP